MERRDSRDSRGRQRESGSARGKRTAQASRAPSQYESQEARGRSRYESQEARGRSRYESRETRGRSRYESQETRGRSRYDAGTGRSRYGAGTARSTDRRYSDRQAGTAQDRKGRQPAKKRNRSRRPLLFFVLFLVLAAVCAAGAFYFYQNQKGEAPVEISVDLTSLDSPYAVVIDGSSGEVIGSKKGDEKIFPASMAKIMTVLTAIEHIKDLDQTITMSYDYYDTLYAQDASRAGFEPGESAVIRDLLYGALLPSGAECCMELSIQAAGSEEAFAGLMNQKAQEIGLTQTHFVNCTGLHDENQYSTPHEIGLILREALKNKTFRKVFTTASYTVGATDIHPEGFTFQSSMFKNMESSTVIGGEIMGGKTGYTQEAGHCLASMAEIEGREYILVTAGWAENPRVEQYHINDAYLGYNLVGRAVAELQ